MRHARITAVAWLALAILPACLSGEGEAGIGLPQQRPGEEYPGEREELAGTLEVTDRGCITVVIEDESFLVVWPAGSELDDAVRLPNGQVLPPDARIAGVGAKVRADVLTADANGYWSNAIGFCAPEDEHVVVFDEVELDESG